MTEFELQRLETYRKVFGLMSATVEGRTDLAPTDTWLKPYLEWRRSGGPAVEWDRFGHSEWRIERRKHL